MKVHLTVSRKVKSLPLEYHKLEELSSVYGFQFIKKDALGIEFFALTFPNKNVFLHYVVQLSLELFLFEMFEAELHEPYDIYIIVKDYKGEKTNANEIH